MAVYLYLLFLFLRDKTKKVINVLLSYKKIFSILMYIPTTYYLVIADRHDEKVYIYCLIDFIMPISILLYNYTN